MASEIEDRGLYFEAFSIDRTWRTPAQLVTAEGLLDYARAWDPLPIHTDEDAAAASPHGELIASGEHTFVVMRRALWDLGVTTRAIRIAEQRELRFLAPARIGDRLTTEARCNDLQADQSRPMGLVTLDMQAVNQDGVAVLRGTVTLEIPREPRPAD